MTETQKVINVLSLYTWISLKKKKGIHLGSTQTKTEHYKDEQNLAQG